MEYKVTIGRNNKFYGLEKDMAEPGSVVYFRVPFVTDSSTSVKTDDVKLERDPYDNGYYRYHFTMPEKDVEIAVEIVGDMMCRNINTGLGMMNFTMGPMMAGNQKEEIVDESDCQVCECCGHKNSNKAKFCSECGAKLASKKVED